MNAKLLMIPLCLIGALMVGCDDKNGAKADASAEAKAAETRAAADKSAADAKAAASKDAADAKASAEKAAANARAATEKDAANLKAAAIKDAAVAKAEADKAAANAKIDADRAGADAIHDQAAKLLSDLQTAVTGQKWSDASPLIKQLDTLRDRLAADQKATFDVLKKQYDAAKP